MVEYEFYRAIRSYSPNETIVFIGRDPCEPTDPKRIQISETEYIKPQHIFVHSCNPNGYIDWETLTMRALKNIQSGAFVSYHYGTSEDDYTVGAFHCECGSNVCLGDFRGFAFMDETQRERIQSFVSPYIRKKYYNEELRSSLT